MNTLPPIIEFQNVSLSYNSDAGDVVAVRDLTFSIPSGQFIAIVGPSGSGKTTVLRLLGDLIQPTSGSITVGLGGAKEARVNGCFSYCFQNPLLLGWRNCVENVRLPLEIMRHCSGRDPHELLALVGLAGCEKRYPHQLSGGMKQRVALARSLVYEAKVLVLDEPFAAVDEITRVSLNYELLALWKTFGFTCILSTHSISEAIALADRVIVLTKSPGTVKSEYNVPFTRPRNLAVHESEAFTKAVRHLREQIES